MYEINFNTPSGSVPLTSYEREEQPSALPRELTQEEKDEAQQSRWLMLQTALRSNQGFDPDSRVCRGLQKEIDLMVAEGFVFKPKVLKEEPRVVAPPPIKRFEEASLRELYPEVKELVKCSICGERITAGIAKHKTDEGYDCILDAERARKSGMSAERIADALDRQARAKENQ